MTDDARELAARYVPLARKVARKWGAKYPPLADEVESAVMWRLCDLAATHDPGRGGNFATRAAPALNMAACGVFRTDVRRKAVARTRTLTPRDAGGADDPPGPFEASEPLEALTVTLAGGQRRVLRLLYGDGLTVDEAAAAGGVHRSTVAAERDRALASLRHRLGVGA